MAKIPASIIVIYLGAALQMWTGLLVLRNIDEIAKVRSESILFRIYDVVTFNCAFKSVMFSPKVEAILCVASGLVVIALTSSIIRAELFTSL